MSDKIKTAVKADAIESVDSQGEIRQTELTSTPMVIGAKKLSKIKETLKKINGMTAGAPLSPRYKKIGLGESFKGVFLGFKSISTQKQANLVCAGWMEEDGSTYINAGTNLVQQLMEYGIEPGAPLFVKFETKDKTSAGHEVFVFEIRPLESL